jgi:hypothetical protein
MIHTFPSRQRAPEAAVTQPVCEHRAVSRDGRIVCAKITQGDNAVTPDVCRNCPARSVNCSHLRFSLTHSPHVPLVVRFNGRTEVWNDEPPALQFEQAACALQVLPIGSPTPCAGCSLRQPLADAPAPDAAAPHRTAARRGKVVPFEPPEREAVAKAG